MEMDDDNDDGDVYEVEKIVDNVVMGEKTFYRVRWKNYDEDGDTWEPRENLLSCEDLLSNYIRAQSEKTSGLSLPEDVFTAGTGDSETESEKGRKNDKKMKIKSKENKKVKEAKKKQTKKHKSRAYSTSENSSEEEPQVKDPFWDNLKEGKIDVFASDLYSKVKQRRPPSKEEDSGRPDIGKEVQSKDAKSKKRVSGKKKNSGKQETESMPDNVTKTRKGSSESQLTSATPSTRNTGSQSRVEMENAVDNFNISDDNSESNPDQEPNMVLQYLEKEIKNKKGKKKEKKKKDEEQTIVQKQADEKDSGDRKSFMNLFEESEAAVKPDETHFAEVKRDKSSRLPDNISKPNIVLEKLQLPKKDDESLLTKTKDKKSDEEKGIEKTSIARMEAPVISMKEEKLNKEKEKTTSEDEKPPKDVNKDVVEAEKSNENLKILKKNNKDDASDIEIFYDSDKSDAKSRPVNDVKKQGKKENHYRMVDAFSAQLQESDQAVTDLLIKKKTKKHKTHAPSQMRDKASTPPSQKPPSMSEKPPMVSPTVPFSCSSGASVLEMLTQEMERTVTMGTSSVDPKLTPFEAAVKDAHSKLGLKPPSGHLSSIEKQQQTNCAPDMVEFLKIKVNFELDEISVKDIERHHEMGEPPCRLERDVTNAEFRQYIRSNNFEMVHEALKSKKMMYNLEHTDSVWMTQLMVAAAAGFDEIVKILAHHGARVNARSKIGQSALMFAADKGHDIVCRILIAYGAYINMQTTTGETALMKAAKNGHHMIVRYLLQAGADPSLKSPHGTTALQMAERANHVTLAELINEHEMNITAHVNECIHRECHNLGIKTIGLPILATRLYNIRETPLVHVTFNCVLQSVPPNQGLMLFALHGMMGSGLSIKCRMRGPCHVNAVTLNNFVMDPMMPGKQASDEYTHYITHLVWKTGQNSLRLFLDQDALSNEKLFISVYQCGFID